jgi:5-methylcytosine-specific restriction protein B
MQARMQQAFNDGEDYIFVAFHPSYSYEDFVGGLRPMSNPAGNGIHVAFEKGPFLRLCEKAHADSASRFTVFIDEINRANVAKVFGELITLIEPSKRVMAGSEPNESGAWVTLPGIDQLFGVPDNIDFVATMNTADRSIAMMDLALRRRFRFIECPPDSEAIVPAKVGNVDVPQLLRRLNDRLEYLLDRDHVIGHAPFIGLHSVAELAQVIAQRIIPLLQEYFFEDYEKVQLVLTGSSKNCVFLEQRDLSPQLLFPNAQHIVGTGKRTSYVVTDPNNWTEQDILAMYEPSIAASATSETSSEE